MVRAGGVEADESLADRFAILISIPGVSNITAFALLIAMPELGSLEAGQAANLAGLAPIARQSGRWTGRSFIRGGRADVRQALYMPALVAARFNPDMKAKYAHQNRKTRKSRPDRDHAKAGRPRKCPPKGKSHLDAKNRLINTDTLALHSGHLVMVVVVPSAPIAATDLLSTRSRPILTFVGVVPRPVEGRLRRSPRFDAVTRLGMG